VVPPLCAPKNNDRHCVALLHRDYIYHIGGTSSLLLLFGRIFLSLLSGRLKLFRCCSGDLLSVAVIKPTHSL